MPLLPSSSSASTSLSRLSSSELWSAKSGSVSVCERVYAQFADVRQLAGSLYIEFNQLTIKKQLGEGAFAICQVMIGIVFGCLSGFLPWALSKVPCTGEIIL